MAHEAATIFSCMRHLLNVRIGAGKAPGRRADLPKVGMQPACLRIDELDHVLSVTGQGLLHRAVLEQLRDDRILCGQRLQLPIASRIGKRNAEPRQCLGDLRLRIEIDVCARRSEQRCLGNALAEHLLQFVRDLASFFFHDRQLFKPALLVHIKARQFQIDNRHHAFEFKLRATNQSERLDPLDQSLAQRKQHRGIARRIFQLRLRKVEFPIAQPFGLINCFIQIASRDCLQAMTLFDIPGRNQLTCQQRVE